MMVTIGKQLKEWGPVGVDTGQIMVVRADVGRQIYQIEEDLGRHLNWSVLVLKDGRRLVSGGKDFFNWGEPLPEFGLSPNDMIDRGLAVQHHPVSIGVGGMSMGGACSASNHPRGFGLIGRDPRDPEGIVFHVRMDGGYPVHEASCEFQGKTTRFAYIAITEDPVLGQVNRLHPIECIKTMGSVCITDPCFQPNDGMDVESDLDGMTIIYGTYGRKFAELSGFALPLK